MRHTRIPCGACTFEIVTRLCAIIGDALSEEELKSFLGERLVVYKVPRTYEFVDFALRDDAGKVRRSALRAERIGNAQ